MFVLHHLNDILELLMEPGSFNITHVFELHCYWSLTKPLKSWIFFRLLYAIAKIAIITARIILHLKTFGSAKLISFCLESSANNGHGSEACLTVEALDALGFLIAGATEHRSVVIDHISKDLYCQFKWNIHWFLRLELTEGLLILIPFM